MSTPAIRGEEKSWTDGCLGINPGRWPDSEKGKRPGVLVALSRRADTVNRPHSRLVADKHRIERELMNLVIGPDKAAINA
jgi:hypothetical protein